TTAAVRLKHIAGAGLRAAFLPLLFPLLIFYPAEYAAWNLIRVLQAVGVLLGCTAWRLRGTARSWRPPVVAHAHAERAEQHSEGLEHADQVPRRIFGRIEDQ